MRWSFAFLHLVALAVGPAAIWARARALRILVRDRTALRTVFDADACWLAALLLWLITGLIRVLAGLEKPAAYYAHSPVFWTKMAVFAVVFVLELWPMTTILQWGFWSTRGRPIDFAPAHRMATISYAQLALVLLALGLAAALARGIGL